MFGMYLVGNHVISRANQSTVFTFYFVEYFACRFKQKKIMLKVSSSRHISVVRSVVSLILCETVLFI